MRNAKKGVWIKDWRLCLRTDREPCNVTQPLLGIC